LDAGSIHNPCMRSLLTIGIILLGCSHAAGEGGKTPGAPLETREPNAPWQKPAFPGQTRAPYAPSNVKLEVVTVVKGLEHPWGMAFLPDGSILVTEREGRLRVAKDGKLSPAVKGLPEVAASGQGGLLDVLLDPKFAENGSIFWSYSEPRQGGNGTAVARGRLVLGAAPRVEDVKVIWRMTPTLDSRLHFGSRLVWRRDGTLFITTGERSILEGRRQAQRLDGTFGKVVRVHPDGSIPQDNPLVNRPGARPEIWSWGHRNIQSAALHPRTGALWIVEHGARGGDEINIAEAGKDYGWPTITYGVEYSGNKIGEGKTAAPGMEQPIYYWDPVIAPSGMAFYDADLFPAWKGSLFVGALAGKHLARLALDGTKVVGEERLLAGRARIRDVRVGPDGAVYVATDEGDDAILKLVPAKK
jgi:glucose/arabinose dehydrogenase